MTSRTPGTAVANGEHHNHSDSTRRQGERREEHHHHYYPTTPYYSSSSAASFKGCCCCLFLLFSFLGLLILAVVLVIVLAVKPKKPQFDLQQVGVQYVGITANPTTTDSASLSLNIRMLFTASNPNKVGIKYGESRFTVMYRGIPLGEGRVAGFYQPAHSVRQVETSVAVDKVNLMQADAADLIKDASLYDRVELRVLGDVGAKIRVLDFTSPEVNPLKLIVEMGQQDKGLQPPSLQCCQQQLPCPLL
ncbi:Late embryogenesis abundant protein, LEA_2 subgroup [Dillenia turbinata]|uniref:Late embryogenesis abundant protein, LEA_2 subgroup n=1 Tax=Dillenia turbinata TaxID=194707 RepID=A0AAN8USP4_9MAGN